LPFEPDELVEPGLAERLAEARNTSGREIGELAALLGVSYEAYWDLESFDEEIVDTISFDQLIKLCRAIGLEPRSFFASGDLGYASFGELATRLTQVLTDESLDVDELEDEVGWELRAHLEEPGTFGELPAVALADIGERFGIDWRSFLPRDRG
jgi:transcriptional regulator with XRE-family HTH domain